MNGQRVLEFKTRKEKERMYNDGTAAKRRKHDGYEFVMNYSDAMDIHEEEEARRRRKSARNRENRTKYFFRQRMMGLGVVAMGAGVIASTKIIETPMLNYLGLMIGALGLYIFMTKNMVLIDRYYFECQDRLNEC